MSSEFDCRATPKNGDRRSDQKSRCPVIYFHLVNSSVDPMVKIGYTENWRRREADHKRSKLGVKVEVDPICMIRGTRADEKAIQRYFASFAVPNEEEVFWPKPPLVSARWASAPYPSGTRRFIWWSKSSSWP